MHSAQFSWDMIYCKQMYEFVLLVYSFQAVSHHFFNSDTISFSVRTPPLIFLHFVFKSV